MSETQKLLDAAAIRVWKIQGMSASGTAYPSAGHYKQGEMFVELVLNRVEKEIDDMMATGIFDNLTLGYVNDMIEALKTERKEVAK